MKGKYIRSSIGCGGGWCFQDDQCSGRFGKKLMKYTDMVAAAMEEVGMEGVSMVAKETV